MLKRFKNRLKTFDNALGKVAEKKADRHEFEKLANDLQKDRAVSVFNDMKILFDTTVNQFDEKIIYERRQIRTTYERLLQEQRKDMLNFEKRYNHLILSKVTKLEDFVNELAIEQAKLLEKFIW